MRSGAEIKLGLVAFNADASIRNDVSQAATDAGFDCKVVDDEADAIDWVETAGGERGHPEDGARHPREINHPAAAVAAGAVSAPFPYR